MLFSQQEIFSDNQNLTSSGASTNIIDLLGAGTVLGAPAKLTKDIGKGKPIYIIVQLTADAGGTSPTLQVDVQVDTVEGFGSPTTVGTASISDGLAGDDVWVQVYLPEGVNQRYLRLNYTLGGTSPDYTVFAGVTLAKQSNVVPGAA